MPSRVDRAEREQRRLLRHVLRRIHASAFRVLPVLRQVDLGESAAARRGDPTDRILRVVLLHRVPAVPSEPRGERQASSSGGRRTGRFSTAGDRRAGAAGELHASRGDGHRTGRFSTAGDRRAGAAGASIM